MEQNKIQIYQTADGQARIDVRLKRDTVGLSQAQMAELFDKDSDTIGLHLKNIYQSGELEEGSTAEESSVVRQEGKRQVKRRIIFYNLDAIISVGYRVNSITGTRFRQWATHVLREHLVKGYTLHQSRFEKNAAELEQALTLIRKTAQSPALTAEAGSGLVEMFAHCARFVIPAQAGIQ